MSDDETQTIVTDAIDSIEVLAPSIVESQLASVLTTFRRELIDLRREKRKERGDANTIDERLADLDQHVKAFCDVASDGAKALTTMREELASIAAQLADTRALAERLRRELSLERALGDHAELTPAQRALLRRAYEGDQFPDDAAAWIAGLLPAVAGASAVDASTHSLRARRDALLKG